MKNKRIDIVEKKIYLNLRERTLFIIMASLLALASLVISGILIDGERLMIDLDHRNEAPSLTFPFGTDWLGRDMLMRTLKGLTLSFGVGMFAAFSSTLIALAFSLLSTWNRTADKIVSWLIDLFLSVPHIVTLILISFVVGGGLKGIVVGLALTHWPSLTRLLRAEVIQLKSSDYIKISQSFGKSSLWIGFHHFLPHLLPHLLIGFILLFPHVILHEAAVTFLGFGLAAETPAIGIILSESMRYLSTGYWWLAFFPGFSLLLMVFLFELIGRNIQRFIDPFQSRKL